MVRLPNGTEVRIRPIRPDDKARLQAALAGFSQETVRRRFFTAKPRLSANELRYLTEVDGHDHIALVAVAAEDPSTIVGVARSVRLAEAPDTAEWAIVVVDEWQGQGLGGALARALADAARRTGIRRIAAVMLGDNAPARRVVLRIARRLAGDTPAVVDNHVHDGVRELTVEIAA
jgi:acetyltransferase